MRLYKLSLLFVLALVCISAPAQTATDPGDQAVTVPRHTPNQLYHRFDYARSRELSDVSNGDMELVLRKFAAIPSRSRIRPGIAIAQGSELPGNTCYKLRKYILQPKQQTLSKGVTPLGAAPVAGDWQIVGETDCTPSRKVWPKSVDGQKPPQSQFGVHSTVLRQK